jgi:hypothetical protein
MKHALRFIVVAMIFATAGLFAQAATETTAGSQPQKIVKVVKKTAKKHKKHKKQKTQ